MSLVNDVLRDLDARRAEELACPGLQREVRALPERQSSLIPRALVMLLIVTVVAVGVTWYLLPASPAPKAPLPVSEAAAPLQPTLLPVGTELLAAGERLEPMLRFASSLSTPPAEAAVAVVSPLRGKYEQSSKGQVEPSVVASSSVKSAAIETRSTGSVEKKPIFATPRDRAEAEVGHAQGLLAQDRSNEAMDSLRSALRHDPAYSPARQLWLKLLLEQKRFDEVISILQDGLELQPNQIGWAMTLARLKLEKNDAAAAERVLATSFGFGAGNPAYLGFYGHVRSRLGQPREAVDLYQAAARLAPGDGRWWFGLAAALESIGRAGEARDAYRQAQTSGNLPPELMSIAEQRLAR